MRDVKANGRILIPMPRKPVRVATLMDEQAFSRDKLLIHLKTVFFEDRVHDWTWDAGNFRYYTRIAQQADVVVVYEEQQVAPGARFDSMTGAPLA